MQQNEGKVRRSNTTHAAGLTQCARSDLFEFLEKQNVQIVPAINAVQLFVTTEDGTGEGKILYMRNVPGGCDSMTSKFEASFDSAFKRFIQSIREAY